MNFRCRPERFGAGIEFLGTTELAAIGAGPGRPDRLARFGKKSFGVLRALRLHSVSACPTSDRQLRAQLGHPFGTDGSRLAVWFGPAQAQRLRMRAR